MLPEPMWFGPFEVRQTERVVLKNGEVCPVGPRAFDVLLALLKHAGGVVRRDDLVEEAWPGLTVEENNLSVQISALRKVLGRETIKTVPGRGYQFVGLLDDDESSGPEGSEASAPLSGALGKAGLTGKPASARGSGPPRLTNLPITLAPLFGRADDLARIKSLLAEKSLVTIAGPSGIGKTRVAQAVAHELVGNYADGVWWVEFASLTDPSLVVPTIARTLHIALSGRDDPAKEVIDALQGVQLLIVLDNCEHLIETVSVFVYRLFQVISSIAVLSTSQELLRVPEEQLYRLPALALPAPGETSPAEQSGAVRLFVERVKAVDRHFSLVRDQVDNTAAVVEVCRQLEGIPLALELAAARVPMYGVTGMLERLQEGLQVLTAGARVKPRHRTLRSALDWSHGLLGPEEQAVFRRLSIFVGGFTVEAAQLVARDDSIDEWMVVEHLSSLVDKSLVSVDHSESPRYSFLEMTRGYALERLHDSGEAEVVARQHALGTLAMITTASRQRDVNLFVKEMNNVRIAFAWALGKDDEKEAAVGLATASSVVLAVEGFVVEALNRHLQVRPLVDDGIPQALAAQYWQWLGRIGMDGRLPVMECVEALDRAGAMYAELGNLRHQHACLRMKSQALLEATRLSQACIALDQATAMEEQGLPLADRMRRLRIQGMVEDRSGLHKEALATWSQAYELSVAGNIERYQYILMADMAGAYLKMGDACEAAKRYSALAMAVRGVRSAGLTLSYALAGLTAALLADQQVTAARTVALEAVPHLRRAGLLLARGDVFALLLALEGRSSDAARFLGAADAARRDSGSKRDAVEEAIRAQVVGLIEASDDTEKIDVWTKEGSALSEDELVFLLR